MQTYQTTYDNSAASSYAVSVIPGSPLKFTTSSVQTEETVFRVDHNGQVRLRCDRDKVYLYSPVTISSVVIDANNRMHVGDIYANTRFRVIGVGNTLITPTASMDRLQVLETMNASLVNALDATVTSTITVEQPLMLASVQADSQLNYGGAIYTSTGIYTPLLTTPQFNVNRVDIASSVTCNLLSSNTWSAASTSANISGDFFIGNAQVSGGVYLSGDMTMKVGSTISAKTAFVNDVIVDNLNLPTNAVSDQLNANSVVCDTFNARTLNVNNQTITTVSANVRELTYTTGRPDVITCGTFICPEAVCKSIASFNRPSLIMKTSITSDGPHTFSALQMNATEILAGELAATRVTSSNIQTNGVLRIAVPTENSESNVFMSFNPTSGLDFGRIRGISSDEAYTSLLYVAETVVYAANVVQTVANSALGNPASSAFAAALIGSRVKMDRLYASQYDNPRGGVVYASGGSDYSEMFPCVSGKTKPLPGQVVSIHKGEVDIELRAGSPVGVVSSTPCFTGNIHQEGVAIAFRGQVHVMCLEPVVGEIAVGFGGGIAVSVPVDQLTREQLLFVIGRIINASEHPSLGMCHVLLGVNDRGILRRRVSVNQKQ